MNYTEVASAFSEAIDSAWYRSKQENEPNFWDIIEYGHESYETRQSKMLRWLLDPNENHGLGTRFIEELVTVALRDGEEDGALESFSPRLFGNDTLSETEVTAKTTTPEGKSVDGRIDIQVSSKQHRQFILVENKFNSSEHEAGKSEMSQLAVYREHAEREFPAEGEAAYSGLMIYLAKRGNTTSEAGWHNVAHEDLLPIYQNLINSSDSEATKKIIHDFMADIRKKTDESFITGGFAFLYGGPDTTEDVKGTRYDELTLTPNFTAAWALAADEESEFTADEDDLDDDSRKRYEKDHLAQGAEEARSTVDTNALVEAIQAHSPHLNLTASTIRAFARDVLDIRRIPPIADHTPSEALLQAVQTIWEHMTDVAYDPANRPQKARLAFTDEDLRREYGHCDFDLYRTGKGQGLRILGHEDIPTQKPHGLLCLQGKASDDKFTNWFGRMKEESPQAFADLRKTLSSLENWGLDEKGRLKDPIKMSSAIRMLMAEVVKHS